MLVVSALYPNSPGSRFDGAYYTGPHAAFARELLAPRGLLDLRITLGEAALDGAPPPFWAIGELHFTSRSAFDAAMAEVGAQVLGDAANYTDVQPLLQISRLAE